MDTSRFVRYAPLTGVIYFLLALAGAIVLGSSPDFAGKPSEFVEYYTDDKGRVILGSMLFLMATFFLLWFVGSLAAAARTAEGGDGRLSRLVFGGGMVGGALLAVAMSVNAMAAFRVDEQGSISDDLATAYGDLSNVIGFLGSATGFAVMAAATAIVNSRTPFLPRWISWLSGLLALGLFEPYFSFLFVIITPLWVLIVSSMLFLRQEAPVSSAS